MLLFTVGLSVASGILFGLAPAAGLGRLDLHGTLKEAARGSSGGHAVWGRGNSLRRLLVVAELALSVVLLIGAGLLIRSVAHLQGVPPGFTASQRPHARTDDDRPQVRRRPRRYRTPTRICGNDSTRCPVSRPPAV